MKTSDFYYDLPEELIAQDPLEDRSSSRLMMLDKETGKTEHHVFREIIDELNPGDCLVINDTKVIPARLIGAKEDTGAKIEVLLLKRGADDVWETLVKPGKKARPGARISFGDGLLVGEVMDVVEEGNRLIHFEYEGIFEEILDQLGQMPLPPYITHQLQDKDRYNTVYAAHSGSAAAPTAGLHFTPELLEEIRAKGVEIAPVTLHVGLGTFRPVKVDDVEKHHMHSEFYMITEESAQKINHAKEAGHRVICVGTTSCRTIESAADENGRLKECSGWTEIFIYPGYQFKILDALITNFHLPESTLIMLVSALAGKEHVMAAYEEAVKEDIVSSVLGMRCSYDRKGQPMSENDFIIVDEEETNKEDNRQDTGREEEKKEVTTSDHSKKDDDGYERICFICHRPESVTGKMVELPNNIAVCPDCMQRSFDMMNNSSMDLSSMMNIPGVHFMNLSDLENMQPKAQKIKKKKKEPKEFKQLDIKKIPAPHKIKARLDEYIVGQEYAKKAISVAVYNHYKRVATGTMDEIEIEKSNMLMIGPTGCGKTYLVKTLAKLLDVPLAITDATSLTEAGYIGDDIESVVSKLLAAADNDVERAEQGIIFIDEIDKIAKKKTSSQRDVSGESVQQGMLKLLEGSEVEVPVGANSKNAMVPLTTVNTKNILFICGGAFPDLEDIIKERLQKKTSMGFNAELKDTVEHDEELLSKVTIEDLRKFGMIPEFLGRLPIVFTLKGLDKEMLVKILKEPKNAILKQYQKLLALDEVKLEFDDSALEAIAEKAMEKDTGARALRAIIEEFMLDIMYEIPKDDNIGEVTITRAYIEGTGGPVIQLRGQAVPRLDG